MYVVIVLLKFIFLAEGSFIGGVRTGKLMFFSVFPKFVGDKSVISNFGEK